MDRIVLAHDSSSYRAFVNVKKFSNRKEWEEVCLRADLNGQIECGQPVSHVWFHIQIKAMIWGNMQKKSNVTGDTNMQHRNTRET
jgi:hypothetical protein